MIYPIFYTLPQEMKWKRYWIIAYGMWLEYKAGRQNGEVKKGIKTSKIKLSCFLKSIIILTLMMIFKKQVPLDASCDIWII